MNYIEAALMVVIPITFIIGLYYSHQINWGPFRHWRYAISLLSNKQHNRGFFSSFSALSSVLGGNLGVGNIAGIAIALKTGGPGSIVWMWVMAILGACIKMVGCVLGVIYRRHCPTIGHHGGPMYYIRDGLKSPFWASIFCLVTIFAALTVGNMTQVNSFILSLPTSWIEGATNHLAPLLGMDGSHHHWLVPAILGLGVSLFLGLTFLGGVHCFAVISSILVPLMAVAYFLGCGVVLIKYYDQILPSLWLILRSSLGMEAMAGGVGGYTIMRIIQVGFNRGLFATDAGAGLEAMLHATVSTVNDDDPKDAFRQGLISAIAPIVVAFLCTITALVLLTTGVWTDPTLASSTMCIRAFSTVFGPYANGFMCFIIGCFAITTIMTWSFCCDRAVEFLIKKPSSFGKILFLMVAPLGAMIQVHHVWTLGDIAFNSMLMINLVAVARLSPKVLPQIRSWINSF